MRILHLIDPGSPGCGQCTLRMLAGLISHQTQAKHDVLVTGSGVEIELARRCGVELTGGLRLSQRLPLSGKTRLRQRLRSIDVSAEPYALIHSWSPRCSMLAALAAPHRPRIATWCVGPERGAEARLLPIILDRAPSRIFAISDAVRMECEHIGLPASSISVIDPGVDFGDANGLEDERRVIRRQWTEESLMDDGDFLVGMLAEPSAWLDARMAVEIVGRVALSRRKVRAIVHPNAANRPHAERLVRSLELDGLCIFDERVSEPWRILGALDAAVWLGRTTTADCRWGRNGESIPHTVKPPVPSILPALWACVYGVPLIAEKSPATNGLISAGVPAIMIAPADINAASAALARLCDDRTAGVGPAWSAARAMPSHLSMSSFVDRIDQAYDDALNLRINA